MRMPPLSAAFAHEKGRRPWRAPAFGSSKREALDGGQVARRILARATVALEVVGNLLAFVQAAQARAFHRGDVDEDVLAAVIRLDEAVALGGVEPFHCAGS